jgi:hypothetical protein
MAKLTPRVAPLNRRTALALLSSPLLAMIGERVAAQTDLQSYDVELVIFRNLSSAGSSEEWAAEKVMPAPDSSDAEAQTEAAPITAPTATFPALPTSKMKLNAIEDTLRRSRRYQPLAHFGWTQPGYARGDARFIPLDSLMGTSSSGLTGRIALARGRYLHLTLDIALTADGQRYLLQQTRRMRSTERHYIDHPKFGVIALITPTEA